MRAFLAEADRGGLFSVTAIALSLAVFSTAVVAGAPAQNFIPVLLFTIVAAVGDKRLLAWQNLLAATILIILFIPIRRYSLPGSLPFDMEPYRLCVALVAGAWFTSLLIDPRVNLRRSGLDIPLVAIFVGVVGSVVTNGERIHELDVGTTVNKKVTFLLSFFLVYYIIVSLVRTREQRDFLVRVLVGGGAVVAFFALIEYRTHHNFFNDLGRIIPVLNLTEVPSKHDLARAGRVRTYASAQHPIAFGAAMAVLAPFGVYLSRARRQWRWYLATALIFMACLATLSRTSALMLFVIVIVFFRHRPDETRQLLIPLLLPAALAIHFALPGAIGSFQESFFPKGGLVKEQQKDAGTVGSGRVADLGPSLQIWGYQPVFGYGYATRVVDGAHPNAMTLDDQWLGTLMEVGLVGTLAWAGLFVVFIRRASRRAKKDPSDDGWLLTAMVASVAAFAWGMFTYDAYSFIQVTFLIFIVLALGATALLEPEQRSAGR
jgi:large-conductance mechanosensitive channel